MTQTKEPQAFLSKERELELKIRKVALMEQQLKLKDGLPHLYGLKKYQWQRDFYDSTNKKCLLCAANQIGKSTEQILKRVNIAMSTDMWPKLWPAIFKVNPKTVPYSWYLYPNQDTVKSEVENKWERYYLPRVNLKIILYMDGKK